MNSVLAGILNAVIGNPLTGIPGAVGLCALAGPAVEAFGAFLIDLGHGISPWEAGYKFISRPEVAGAINSIGLIAAKDWNMTGGTKSL